MNISFTGIRNASGIFVTYNEKNDPKMRVLNTQLKDDADGNDLTVYKQLIEKYPKFKNPYYSNFANITTFNYQGYRVIRLNGTDIPENDAYLPLFSFIGKLTKKISNLPDDRFLVDSNYLKSDYLDNAPLLNRGLSQVLPVNLRDDCINQIHAPQNVKYAAKIICNDVDKCMMNYFA